MKYLLDTSIFLWSAGPLGKLNQRARDLLADGSQELYLSTASVWEIVIKSASGKLELPEPPNRLIPNSLRFFNIHSLPITHSHALAVGELPTHHQDPFDRMLIAQARAEDLILMTSDRIFSKYPVKTFWCG